MKIVLTVTNDLTYDQRMQRIARTLQGAGCEVTLIGRHMPGSKPLSTEPFAQMRLHCRFSRGFLFYAEYNLRLFFKLLVLPMDALGTVDFDTMPGGCTAAMLRRKKRIFDAHEWFTEVPELENRRAVRAIWRLTGRIFLSFYHRAYTVGPALAAVMSKKYGLPFAVVRNMPMSRQVPAQRMVQEPKVIFYQGALNAGRGIEAMLEAMQNLPGMELWLAGEGDLSDALRRITRESGLAARVRFLGLVPPRKLPALTRQAWIGINLLENRSLSYCYSLANKFFDYVQEHKPVITMDFPEYRSLNSEFEVALLLPELSATAVCRAVGRLEQETGLYDRLAGNCKSAAREWIWENEEHKLLEIWKF